MITHSYGYCPKCGAPGIHRVGEKDMCVRGCVYKSSEAFLRPRHEQEYIIQIEKELKKRKEECERLISFLGKAASDMKRVKNGQLLAEKLELHIESIYKTIEYSKTLFLQKDNCDSCKHEYIKEGNIQVRDCDKCP